MLPPGLWGDMAGMESEKQIIERFKREVKTSVLNGVIMDAYTLNIPPSYKGKTSCG